MVAPCASSAPPSSCFCFRSAALMLMNRPPGAQETTNPRTHQVYFAECPETHVQEQIALDLASVKAQCSCFLVDEVSTGTIESGANLGVLEVCFTARKEEVDSSGWPTVCSHKNTTADASSLGY